MQQLALGICDYAELTVIGPGGCKLHLPDTVTVHETSSKFAPFLLLSTWLALTICRKKQFDVVIGGSGLIAPTLRLVSVLFGRRTLVYLHGLDLIVDNAIYQLLFVPCLRHIDSIAVNSRYTAQLAEDKGIAAKRIRVVNPGTSQPVPIEASALADFRHRFGIPFQRYMLFAGRMTKRKGLSHFLQHILPLILEQQPELGLVVVGADPAQSINQLGDEAETLRQIAAQSLQERVLFLGNLSDRDLEICFADAAVQVFPLLHVPGDVEGFGMVAIEAAACGTPTVAFELGGVADAISEGNGTLVPPGEWALFAESVLKILREATPDAGKCQRHASRFTWNHYNKKMQEIILGV